MNAKKDGVVADQVPSIDRRVLDSVFFFYDVKIHCVGTLPADIDPLVKFFSFFLSLCSGGGICDVNGVLLPCLSCNLRVLTRLSLISFFRFNVISRRSRTRRYARRPVVRTDREPKDRNSVYLRKIAYTCA